MKIKLTLFLMFGVLMNSYAQNVTIEVTRQDHVNEAAYNNDSFYFPLNKRLYPLSTGEVLHYKLKNKVVIRSGDTIKTITTHELRDTSLGIIADMFGHEVVLIPNDTIRIFMVKEPINYQNPTPWTRKFTFSGKNRYIHAIFDSLSYVTNDVMSHMLNPEGKTVDEFIKLADDRYKNRLQYLKDYSKKYNIPSVINELVSCEIYSAYLRDLVFLQATHFSGEGAVDLRNIINPKIDFDRLKTKAFLKTVSADNCIYRYLLYMQMPVKADSLYGKKRFVKIYNLIKENYDGVTRDNLLSQHVTNFVNSAYAPYMDSIINLYQKECKDIKAVAYLDSLVQVKNTLAKLTLSEVLSIKIQGVDDSLKNLQNIISGKPTLIDCWASWCKPCIAEFPFSKKLEEEYKGKVNFIYLSFDKDIAAWKSKAKELNITSTYHVPDDFKSNFSGYFNIVSIPRYILIDSNGKLVSRNALRPSDPKLKDILNALLNIPITSTLSKAEMKK